MACFEPMPRCEQTAQTLYSSSEPDRLFLRKPTTGDAIFTKIQPVTAEPINQKVKPFGAFSSYGFQGTFASDSKASRTST